MIDYLGKGVKVVIDRPLGSIHPEHNNIYYMINYGYIPDTVSGDGDEIDAYIIGEFMPVKEYEGTVVALIHRKNDNEDKLVVSRKPIERGFTDNQSVDISSPLDDSIYHELCSS